MRVKKELLERHVMKRVGDPLVYEDVVNHLAREVPAYLRTEERFNTAETQKLLERNIRKFELTEYPRIYVEAKGIREIRLIEAARREIAKAIPTYMRIGKNLYSVKTREALNSAIKRAVRKAEQE
jgi:hypothetical protein